MNEGYSDLVYLAGSLFTRVTELNAVLQRLAEAGQYQGEVHLTHRQANGRPAALLLY
jgi:hypothetical protein